MKIFDCFMYFDEEVVLDVRLNALNKYVDYFIIVESKYLHNGEKRELNFDINKYKKFKDKIIYLIQEKEPEGIIKLNQNDNEGAKSYKLIFNAHLRENAQRNHIAEGLDVANDNDIILISDIDEIPKMDSLDIKSINNELIFFNQKMFYYKFNLCSKTINWFGTRACKKRNLLNPQWLRNIKSRSYPLWRLDLFFSKNKYTNIKIINNGGWHFSYINSPQEIENKLKNYAHYREYELDPLGVEKIQERIINKTTVYNLAADMKTSKFTSGQKLEKVSTEILPDYLKNNKDKYKNWLD